MRKLLAFLAVVAITACDSRVGSSFVAPQTPSIIGSFKLQTVNSLPLPAITFQDATVTESVVADTLTFSSSTQVLHAFTISTTTPPGGPVSENIQEPGTYTISNGVLTIALNKSTGVSVFNGTQNGSTITIIDARHTFVYKK